MARNLDRLIAFLLEEIALCGEQGATASDILAFLREFYDGKPVRPTTSSAANNVGHKTERKFDVNLGGENVNRDDHQTGISDDRPINSLQYTGRQNLDQAFQAKVWEWLTAHPDVRIHRSNSEKKNNVEISQKQNINAPPGPSGPGSPTDNQTTAGLEDPWRDVSAVGVEDAANLTLASSPPTRDESDNVAEYQGLRLRVTEDRIWFALTGHGVDRHRCPRMEFACLSVIASRRYNGILQPELTQLTGQDKRSLPRRTDSLAKKGYILKTLALTRGQRTSHLILRRYANKEALQESRTLGDSGSDGNHQLSAGQGAWGGESLQPSVVVRSLVAEVKKHSVITQADLKWKLGVPEPSWQLKIFKRVLRKLDLMGCIQRVSAEAEVSGVLRSFPCVKFIREPENQEWDLAWGVSFPEGVTSRHHSEGDAAVEAEAGDRQGVEVEDLPSVQDSMTGTTTEGQERTEAPGESSRQLPQWTPGKPIPNLIFELVDAAGTDGISTMALKARALGQLYQRPVDTALDHLTQNVLQSQPPHLRHLAIIRDTAQSKKNCHYQYFSHEHFQNLVDQGKTSWDSVTTSGKERKKKVSKAAKIPNETPKYDEYGFPILPDSLFLGKDGNATLSEIVIASQPQDIVYTTYDPVICQMEDGTYDVDWGDSIGPHGRRRGRPAKRDGRKPKKILGTDVPRKPRGRPRKYPKGQEPYKNNKGKGKGKGRKTGAVEHGKANGSVNERAEQQLQSEASLKRTAEQANLERNHFEGVGPTASGTAPDIAATARPRKRQRRIASSAKSGPSSGAKRTADEAGLGAERSEEAASADIGLVPNSAASSRPRKRQKKVLSSAMATPSRTSKRKQVKTSKVTENETPYMTGTATSIAETNGTVGQASLAEQPATDQAAPEIPEQQSTKGKGAKVSAASLIPSEEATNNSITDPNQRTGLVTILPPGSRSGIKKRGRPKKSKIVVFKVEGLRRFSWFTDPVTGPAEKRSSNANPGPSDAQTAQRTTAPILSVSEGGHQDMHGSVDHREAPRDGANPPEFDDESEPSSKRLCLQKADSKSKDSHPGTMASVDHSSTLRKRTSPSELGNDSEPPAKRRRSQKGNSKGVSEPRRSSSAESVPSTAKQSEPQTAANAQHANDSSINIDSSKTPAGDASAEANQTPKQTTTSVAVVSSANTNVQTSDGPTDISESNAAGSLPLGGEQTVLVTGRYTAEPAQAEVPQVQKFEDSYHPKKSIMKAGSVNFKRKQIIMGLVDKLGGIYPGDKELWYPFSVIWMRENKGSGRPDYKTLLGAQKSLVDSGQLKMFKFCYTNSKGLRSEKKILARMEINANSSLVKDLEQKLKDADCEIYIPPEAGVSVEMKKKLDLRHSYPTRHGNIPRTKIVKDTTSKLTLLRQPVLPVLTPEQQRKAEERGSKRKQKDARRMQRLVGKTNKEMIKLSVGEKREAAKMIREIAKSMPQPGPNEQGPLRVARLYGLQRRDNLQQVALAPTSGMDVADFSLVQPEFLTSVGIQDNTDALKRRALFPLYYKLYRTGLNVSKQGYHSASGTFGTFFSAPVRIRKETNRRETDRRETKKISKANRAFAAPLPSSLEEMLAQAQSRGFVSRISSTNPDPMWRKFENEVDAVSLWEKYNRPTAENMSSSLSYINHTLAGPLIDASTGPETTGKTKGKKTRTRRPKNKKKFKTRVLTAPPGENSGDVIFGNVGPVDPVDVLPPATRRKRRRRGPPRLSAKSLTDTEMQKLLTAVTVIRTLTGGVDRNVDWVIVAKLFKEYDHVVLRKSWGAISAKYKLQLEKLQSEFQDSFLAAYAAGDIPPIDYENLVNYDWEWLVDWALKNLEVPDSRSLPDLPDTREEFDESFEVRNDPEPYHFWRDEYFGLNTPYVKRGELIGEKSLSTPLHGKEQESNEKDAEVQLAKSWIRANVLTSEEAYKPELAKAKLMQLDEDCLTEALNELTSTRVVTHANKGRAIPGRNYDITESFLIGFKKTLHEPHFSKAVAYKAQMDEAFSKPGASVPFTYIASDGESLALINLVAHQRVRLVPRNVPNNRFGLMDGSYRTRFMDKARLHFDLDVVPTNDYIFGNPLLSSPLPPPPRHPDDQEGRRPIPVWYDIHGNFVPIMWKKVLMAVSTLVSMRSGIHLKELRRCLKTSLEEWELKLVLDWLVQIKAFKEVDEGGEIEGWAVGEWWWMVVDTIPALTGADAGAGVEVQGGIEAVEEIIDRMDVL